MIRELEREIDGKKKKYIDPIVTSAVQKVLGVNITELNRDISEKLNKSSLIGINIDTSKSFKDAKKYFKKKYLDRLLQINLGNISEAAKIAHVDRRSIHRLVKDEKVDVYKIRRELKKAYTIKQEEINTIIGDVLDNYKTIIHPIKMDQMYAHVPELSKDILDELPEEPKTLKEAEEEFEKEYLTKALKENNGNVSQTAKKIEIRYETLHRKMKKIGLI